MRQPLAASKILPHRLFICQKKTTTLVCLLVGTIDKRRGFPLYVIFIVGYKTKSYKIKLPEYLY